MCPIKCAYIKEVLSSLPVVLSVLKQSAHIPPTDLETVASHQQLEKQLREGRLHNPLKMFIGWCYFGSINSASGFASEWSNDEHAIMKAGLNSV